MARVRVRRTAVLNFSPAQLELAQRSHTILSALSMDINKPASFDLRFNKENLSYFTATNRPAAAAAATANDASPGESRAVAIDPFLELQVNPQDSHVCAMLAIVRLPGELTTCSLLTEKSTPYYVNCSLTSSLRSRWHLRRRGLSCPCGLVR